MKILITSGCSFSTTLNDNYQCWPRYLSEHYGLELRNKAMGSQGNGLISRGIIHEVTEALETNEPEDILVGAMWSGISRKEFYNSDHDLLSFKLNNTNDGWMENPTGFIKNHVKNWVILNQSWGGPPHRNEEARLYYKYFYNHVGATIETVEHILRTQWFLQQHKIKYFFTLYQDHVFEKEYVEHFDVKKLYKLVDFNKFLPTSSFYTWLVDNNVYSEDFENPHPDNHPSERQNKEFVDKVIIPYVDNYEYTINR